MPSTYCPERYWLDLLLGNAGNVVPPSPLDVMVFRSDHRKPHVTTAIGCDSRGSVELTERGGFPFPIQKQRLQADAFHILRNWDINEVTECRVSRSPVSIKRRFLLHPSGNTDVALPVLFSFSAHLIKKSSGFVVVRIKSDRRLQMSRRPTSFALQQQQSSKMSMCDT